MFDFTLTSYRSLIDSFVRKRYTFQTFEEFMTKPAKCVIVLRHDIDALPLNALHFARIEAENGIKGTYYLRIITGSYDEKIIKEIYSLGHEVGYHYEDLSFAWAKLRVQGSWLRAQGEELERVLAELSIESFKKNLEKFRKIVPVKTICMHGSPVSRWDSRLLWKYYDYHDFEIIGEPYFDVNFDEMLYLTDTGRCWDGDSVNIRDKAAGRFGRMQKANGSRLEFFPPLAYSLQPTAFHTQPSANFPKFHSTFNIIHAAEEGRLPDKIMMTFHPQRWIDKPGPWVRELVYQNIKNVAKYFLLRMR